MLNISLVPVSLLLGISGGNSLNVLKLHLTPPLAVLRDDDRVVHNLGDGLDFAVLAPDLADDLQFSPVQAASLAMAHLTHAVGHGLGLGGLALHVEPFVLVLLCENVVV